MATIQELLKMQGGGASRVRADVNFLLKQIEQNMKKAQQKDRETATAIQKGGKIGLQGIKTRKDYLLAKRANPNLTFKDFLLNPDVSGKNMEEGVSNIVSGQSPEINLREMLGIGNGGDYRTVNRGGFQSTNTGPTTSYPAPMTPEPMSPEIKALNPNFNSAPFNSQVDLPKTPPPSYSATQGLQDRLTAGQVPFDKLGQGAGVNLPNTQFKYIENPKDIKSFTKQNTEQLPNIDVTPQSPLRQLEGSLNTDINKVPTPPDPSTLGKAGNVLGKASSAVGLGKGLYDMGTNKITPSNFTSTLGAGLSLVPGLQPVGLGLSALGALLNRTKYNRG